MEVGTCSCTSDFIHHCFTCCGTTMREYGKGCAARTVNRYIYTIFHKKLISIQGMKGFCMVMILGCCVASRYHGQLMHHANVFMHNALSGNDFITKHSLPTHYVRDLWENVRMWYFV